jgi:fatty acid desaturase
VPLSEEELRLLEQMERALVHEDPKLASTLRGTARKRSARRRVLLCGVALLAGIAILMAGAILQVTLVGIAGFLVMVASATLGLTAWRAHASGETAVAAPGGIGLPTWRQRFDGLRRRKGDTGS